MIFILLGTLAYRAAAGLRGGRLTDVRGVIRTILQQPFGPAILAIIAAGLLAYAAWQAVEGLADTRGRGSTTMGLASRALTILKGLIYGAVGWEAARLALGLRPDRTRGTEKMTAEAMTWPLGDWLLMLVAVGVAAYGARQTWNAVRGRISETLPAEQLRAAAGDWAVWVARAGIIARGVILVVIAVALFRAAVTHRASEAADVGESLRTLITLPYGVWLLAAVAGGLVAYRRVPTPGGPIRALVTRPISPSGTSIHHAVA